LVNNTTTRNKDHLVLMKLHISQAIRLQESLISFLRIKLIHFNILFKIEWRECECLSKSLITLLAANFPKV